MRQGGAHGNARRAGRAGGMMARHAGRAGAGLVLLLLALSAGGLAADDAAPPPENAAQPATEAATTTGDAATSDADGADDTTRSATRARPECPPGMGCVTHRPLPRFVSLKSDEGNARRGPGLNHRIDWVFTRRGMPLRITAEYENWRRVEDREGSGGWMHYVLLSSARTAVVTRDMAELRATPETDARVDARAEAGVIGRILECRPDWCRITSGGHTGWLEKSALWGVGADEIIE